MGLGAMLNFQNVKVCSEPYVQMFLNFCRKLRFIMFIKI